MLYGILPVVITIVAQALWGLGQKAVKNGLTGVVGVLAVILYLLGVNILVVLLLAGLGLAAAALFSLPLLFLTFLKIGATLYGSGYGLLAFLRADFVRNLGRLTGRQLIDAIAIGQVTPGPVSTTATAQGNFCKHKSCTSRVAASASRGCPTARSTRPSVSRSM